MSDHTCSTCQDTGMTRSGFLDCSTPGCNAAVERAAFNERLGISRPSWVLDVAWNSYRMGRKASSAVIAP